MMVELGEGLRATPGAPQKQLVVITARGELLVVKGPFQTTNLLLVAY